MKRFEYLMIIFAAIVFIGCESDTQTADSTGTHTHADGSTHDNHVEKTHSHDDAPHGGTIADWGGGKYHVEFTVNHDQQQATVYILGSDATTAAPIAAEEINLAIASPEIQIALKAQPQDGEAEGTSSRFVGTHENLGIVQEYEGKIYGNVADTAYSGDFKEVPHDH